jgi:predicted restriction endonuclease
MMNFASMDPVHIARDISGLSHSGAGDREVWAQFNEHTDQLYWASQEAIKRFNKVRPQAQLPTRFVERVFTGPPELLRQIPVRRAQRFFRETVLTAYNYRCAISGIEEEKLLVAGHIIPWGKDATQSANPRNGIALSALHDKAFDRGLISLDEARRLLVSEKLKNGKRNEIIKTAILEFEGKELEALARYAPDPQALAYHREQIYKAS